MSTVVQVSVVDAPQDGSSDATRTSLPPHWDLTFSENSLLSVYCFVKNFIGASSGSSTVAIDNKIEQAMDLVKSHLMFAVREEVDVLKEKITELMDRISQLEYENGILKASATPETLTQLSQQQPASQPPAQPPSGVPSAPPVQQQPQQQQQHVTSQMVAPSHQGQLQPSQQQQSSAS